MVRVLLGLIVAVILSSCAKSNNFGFEHLEYQRVQKPPRTIRIKNEAPLPIRNAEAPPDMDELDFVPLPEQDQQKNPSVRVVRNSNHIDFTVNPDKSKWDQNTLTMTVTLKVGNELYEDVELTGVEKDSEVRLETQHASLKDKIKANLVCLQKGHCSEFFIEVLYSEDETIYHDQVIATVKQDPSTPAPVVEEAQSPDSLEEKIIIGDEISKDHIIDLGYVGLSESDIWQAFHKEKPSDSASPSANENLQESAGVTPEPQAGSEVKPQPPLEADTKDKSTDPSVSQEGQEKLPNAETKPETPPSGPAHPIVREESPKSERNEKPDEKKEVSILEKLRVKNQVFELPNNGWLERATDFLKLSADSNAFFFITKPQSRTYFGSGDLARLIYKMGQYLNSILPGRKLAITEISNKDGGRVCWRDSRGKAVCHASHQNGIDVDLRYLTHDDYQPANVVDGHGNMISTFRVYEQFKVFMKAVSTRQVDVIFVGSAVKRAMCRVAKQKGLYKSGDKDTLTAETLRLLYPEDNHTNHYHIRAKCSSDNRRCRRIEISLTSTGC